MPRMLFVDKDMFKRALLEEMIRIFVFLFLFACVITLLNK